MTLLNFLPRRTVFATINNIRYSSHSSTSDGNENGSDTQSLVKKDKRTKVTEIKDSQPLSVVKSKIHKYERILRPRDSSLINKGEKKQELVKKLFEKPYEQNYVTNRPIEDPYARTLDNLRLGKKKTKFLKEGFGAFYDVCIIGGGVMGCSIAYFLASRVHESLKICVVEKDPSYRHSTTTLSVGGIRQQFSLPENIMMSLYGADFLRQAQRLLYVHGADMPDIHFQPHGYLFLASEEGAEQLQENYYQQIDCGAKVDLMTPARLKRRFPWINTDGVALGSYGYENEGWFDPWALMSCLRIKATDLGVDFIDGEVYNIAHSPNERVIDETLEEVEKDERDRIFNKVDEVHIYLADGDVWPVQAGKYIIAAGPESGHVAHLAGIGAGTGILRVPLPVEPRKRYVFCVHAPDGPGLNCPLVVDPSGAYVRREGYGGHYLCGKSPDFENEPSLDDLEVDHEFFYKHVWPKIAHRVPALNNCKVKSSWAGFYDYNYWDENAIVGSHPYHDNIVFATGFSGHGIQQAPAIGRAVMEWVFEREYKTIDLERMHFHRFLTSEKIEEKNIV